MHSIWSLKQYHRALGLGLVLAFFAAGCTTSSDGANNNPTGSTAGTESALLTAQLEVVDSCDTLLDRIKSDASARVGPYGLDWQGDVFAPGPIAEETTGIDGDDMIADDAGDVDEESVEVDTAADEMTGDAAAPDAAVSSANSGHNESGEAETRQSAKDVSGTNNQEQGVDEADIVKSDGATLVIVNGSELQVLDVSGDTPQVDQTIDIGVLGQANGMFLNGDQLALLSTDWKTQGYPTSLLTDIDLGSGQIGSSLEFEGNYVSSREVDGTLRLVLSSQPTRLEFVYPDGRTSEKEALEENQEIIAGSDLDDWIPEYRQTGSEERQASQPVVDCQDVHLPTEFSGGGQVTVVTMSLDEPTTITDSVSVHTDAQTVYASTNQLVVAAPQWPEWQDDSIRRSFAAGFTTALHSFNISAPEQTNYQASGQVRGLLLNQFSLSENDEVLRVATTDTEPQSGVSESYVTTFTIDDGQLAEQGQVGNLGLDERIFAVRFIGDVGYVVTFRETDPLYTIDLSDPTNPKTLGELKIPGFSNYLHEIDDRTLLGVGSDGTDDGQVLGAAVSLFDVEDLSDPARLDKLAFNEWAWTPVAEDAKAFTYWPETETAFVPVFGYAGLADDSSETEKPGVEEESVVAVIQLDPEVGRMELVDTVSHTDLCGEPSTVDIEDRRTPDDGANDEIDNQSLPADGPLPVEPIEDYNYCYAEITRSMVIGSDLFVFSNLGISVHPLDNYERRAWVSFR